LAACPQHRADPDAADRRGGRRVRDLSRTGVAGLLVITLTVGSLLGATLHPLLGSLSLDTACAIGVCAYLAANYNAPLTAIALAAEWGGTDLLSLAWAAVLVAAWIGEGLANTPAKVGRRRGRSDAASIGHH
jgi:H+/Cl- antiporter ClcA